MITNQISVFMENKPGRIADVTSILAQNNINIRAINIADTVDFGILRLIVDKPEDAEKELRAHNLSVSIADVVAVSISDEIGSFSELMNIFKNANVNIDYLYSFIGEGAQAVIVIKTDDASACFELVKNCGIKIIKCN